MTPSLSGRHGRLLAATSLVLAHLAVVAPAHTAVAETIYAVTTQNFLTKFDSATPGTIISGVQITGLASNEVILGIDFRPANGLLYGVGSQNRLYLINVNSGFASLVGAMAPITLSGVEFGVTFNPVTDRLRILGNTNQNLRVDPATAGSTADTPLAYAAGDPNVGRDPSITAATYTGNAGVPGTTLYAVDSGIDRLVRIGSVNGTPTSPDTGQIVTIGALGIGITELGGMDYGFTGTIYASLMPEELSQSLLYTLNLTTGAASPVGVIGGGLFIRDIAVVPAPGTLVLLGGAGLLLGRRRR